MIFVPIIFEAIEATKRRSMGQKLRIWAWIFSFLNIHLYHYACTLLWVQSKFGHVCKQKLYILAKYLSLRSVGSMRQFKYRFWSLRNCILHYLYPGPTAVSWDQSSFDLVVEIWFIIGHSFVQERKSENLKSSELKLQTLLVHTLIFSRLARN